MPPKAKLLLMMYSASISCDIVEWGTGRIYILEVQVRTEPSLPLHQNACPRFDGTACAKGVSRIVLDGGDRYCSLEYIIGRVGLYNITRNSSCSVGVDV